MCCGIWTIFFLDETYQIICRYLNDFYQHASLVCVTANKCLHLFLDKLFVDLLISITNNDLVKHDLVHVFFDSTGN
jgi:hypothetical protein